MNHDRIAGWAVAVGVEGAAMMVSGRWLRAALACGLVIAGACASEGDTGDGGARAADVAGLAPSGSPGASVPYPQTEPSVPSAADTTVGAAGAPAQAPQPVAQEPAPTSAGDDGAVDPTAVTPAEPTASGDEWVELVAGDWTLAGGAEEYWCARKTLTEDMYIRGFRAINPDGTHHTVLSVGPPHAADGMAPCATGGTDTDMIYGSGVGTDDVIFPEGVALKVSAGQQVVTNLHLFNFHTEQITGRSGNAVLLADPSEVVQLADNLLAGPLTLNVPPGVETTQVGGCTMPSEVQIFAVQPHLHQTGIYARVVAESASGEVVLHDGPFDFDSQVYYMIDPPVTMRAGERLRVECTYFNTTTNTLRFGTSSEDEMCLASVYRFPATAAAETICAF